MSNPTSNFGWQMPTNTDLVTDLPADFEVFGQGVDTTLADLKGGTTGQILSKATNADMDFTWTNLNPGDITGVTATSPLTGGGTSGDVTIGIQSASTSQSGAVQLTDSTSSTSTTTAATPNAVKSAYDLANSKGVGTITGVTAGTGITGGGTSGAVTVTFDQANYGGGQNAAGKNFLINGAFDIWQRGTSFASTGFMADRWSDAGATSNMTASQQSATPPTNCRYYLRYTTTSSTNPYKSLWQSVETANTELLWGKTVTFSIWIRRDSTMTALLGFAISKSSTVDAGSGATWTTIATNEFSASTITAATWTQITVTGTVPNDGTANTIRCGFYFNNNPANGSYIEFGKAMLEIGSTVTPFQRAAGNIQSELAACQRYYFRYTPAVAYGKYGGYAYSTSTTNVDWSITPKVTMRVMPTSVDFGNIQLVDTTSNASTGTASAIGIDGSGASGEMINAYITTTGATSGRSMILRNNNNTAGYVGFNSEL